jgi:sialate O-acetylesterase
MEMNMNWGLKQYADDITNATNQDIRFFNVLKSTAAYPQEDTKGEWVVCTPEEMKKFSAVGYFFGNRLQQELHAPIGLINASWGGTPAEVWTPKEFVETDTSLKRAAMTLKPSNGWPVETGVTYNAMIYPITHFPVAGAIWYQGESNVGTYSTYQSLFTKMIGAWRKAWQKDFPFLFVQIAPYSGYGNNNNNGALLREAQSKSLGFPNTGMVVVSDLVADIKDIHPINKKDVGLRLANYALGETYAKSSTSYKSPEYKNMKLEKDKIRIYFENATTGLKTKGTSPSEFFIAGDDKIFQPAHAKIDGNTVLVWNPNIKKPVAVRFGFSNSAMPDLYSKEGLPVNLFRTDDWDVNTVVIKQ